MTDFDHKKVPLLIGVVIEKYHVILPFVENGDLKIFISKPEPVSRQAGLGSQLRIRPDVNNPTKTAISQRELGGQRGCSVCHWDTEGPNTDKTDEI